MRRGAEEGLDPVRKTRSHDDQEPGIARAEQARGSFEIAKFYEKKRKIQGALVYYNEVLLLDPTSKYANDSRKRIDELKVRSNGTPN